MEHPYAIAAVAKMTGLSVDTLRAWERRYGAVTPHRDGKGTRRYGEADVKRLKLLRSATAMGHAIRNLAKLDDAELLALLPREPEPGGVQIERPVVQKIIHSIRYYDVWRAEELLTNAAMLSDPQRLVINVLSPLMATVGRLWEQRALSIAQEHLLSVLVRNLLGTLARLRPPSGDRTMLFATPPGESHEFGIALAACLASLRGLRACVLGTHVPVAEVIRAARYLRPESIVFGVIVGGHGIEHYLTAVRAKLPARTSVWVGGPSHELSISQPGIERIPTLQHFCDRLQ